jgi:hypothetical protein
VAHWVAREQRAGKAAIRPYSSQLSAPGISDVDGGRRGEDGSLVAAAVPGWFFLPPLSIQSEVAVQLSIADEELAIEGKIDILVLHDQLWILLIESKRAAASIEVGLPQLLAYTLASPNPVQPVYGMITNGESVVFLKLVQGLDAVYYALSRIFEMRNPGNDLYPVLAVLKHLKHLVLQAHPDIRS